MDPTTSEGFERPRPRVHGLDATTVLQHFALVTFDVDPLRLRAALPTSLEPEVRRLDGGRERGFVSAVSFRDVDFRLAMAPWFRASFFQTNYRAYVHGPDGRRAVFFFGTTLDSRLVAVPRIAWGMPWHPGSTSINAEWSEGGTCIRYLHDCSGRWGAADVELQGTSEQVGRLDGFADADDAALVLTHPLDGFFVRRDGQLGRYAVWHERLRPRIGIAKQASYALFEELDLVAAGAPPHSVLLQRSVEFEVLLPPTLA